jgi:hypothetical protein
VLMLRHIDEDATANLVQKAIEKVYVEAKT